MNDRSTPGTWVRLAQTSAPSNPWHRVAGWREGQVELGCGERDSVLTWALENADPHVVDRMSERPGSHLCGRCRLRERIAAPLFATAAATSLP